MSSVQSHVLPRGQASPEGRVSHVDTDLLGTGPVLKHLYFSMALDACRELVGNKDAPIAGETLEKLHKRLIRNEDD